ncbi:MAG: hypothetical protein E6R04_11605 [Spirochaetes bacterium]|nr:MAG: hypothetical protein E6R04_11605 [Spirochaetota bacterium]
MNNQNEPKKKSDIWKITIGIIVALIVGNFFSSIAAHLGRQNPNNQTVIPEKPVDQKPVEEQKPIEQKPDEQVDNPYAPGRKVLIFMRTLAEELPVATSYENALEMLKYLDAGNQEQLTVMLLSGKIYMVEIGSYATIQDKLMEGGIMRVKIDNGKMKGKEGFVPLQELKEVKS